MSRVRIDGITKIFPEGGGIREFTCDIAQGEIFAMLGQEWVLWRRASPGTDYHPYLAALALITAAAVCSALDVTRVWCDPENHWLQGHAAWHVLSAASLFALYRFYERLPDLQSPR